MAARASRIPVSVAQTPPEGWPWEAGGESEGPNRTCPAAMAPGPLARERSIREGAEQAERARVARRKRGAEALRAAGIRTGVGSKRARLMCGACMCSVAGIL